MQCGEEAAMGQWVQEVVSLSPIKHINPEKAQDSGTSPLNPNQQHSGEILQTLVDDTQEPGGRNPTKSH